MALSDEGHLYAWGANSYGQLGTGNKLSDKTCFSIPSLVPLEEEGRNLFLLIEGLQMCKFEDSEESENWLHAIYIVLNLLSEQVLMK